MTPTPIAPPPGETLDAALSELLEEKLELARADPANAEAHATLALVYQANGMQREALASFRNALALDPSRPLWRLREGRALAALGRNAEAIAAVADAAARLPESAAAQQCYADLLVAAGHADEALERYRATMRLAPRRPEGFSGAGGVLLDQGRVHEAIPLLEQAVSLDPNDRHAHFLLGNAYRAAGRIEAARAQLALGLDAKPRTIPDALHGEEIRYRRTTSARIGQAKSLVERGQPGRARDVLRRALRDDPEDVLVLNNLARVEVMLGEGERALARLARARELDPGRPLTDVNEARVRSELGRPAEALAAAERAADAAPGFAPAHLARAIALAGLERDAEALEALDRAVELAPRDPEALVFGVRLADELGDRPRLQGYLERLVAVTPLDGEASLRLAEIYLNNGDAERAGPLLRRAERALPGDPRAARLAARLERAR